MTPSASMRRRVAGLRHGVVAFLPLLVWLGVMPIAAGSAQVSPATVGVQAGANTGVTTIEMVPAEGTSFGFGDWRYGGSLRVDAHDNGLALVESVPLDAYLAGVREVPLSWPVETLRAQAVAARTYLAWTLVRGRTAAGSTYGFDICATTQCQVYAGTSVAQATDGDRWLAAVGATSNEILVFEGSPAQTLYSSSAGSRTRAVQDVFGGVNKPYLQPVDSPEAGVTPYERWVVSLDVEALRRILTRAGYQVGGTMSDVFVEQTDEGAGLSTFVVLSDRGRLAIPAPDIRWIFNGNGPALYPGDLPAARPNGGRWPQAIMSYTYDVEYQVASATPPPRLLPSGEIPSDGRITFVGEGWGHGVGMSQWGAKALGDIGASYSEILSHYYGGLAPVVVSGLLPDRVEVGLAWGSSVVTVDADGPFELVLNGVSFGRFDEGRWLFRRIGGGITIVPPNQSTVLPGVLPRRQWPG